MKKRNNYGKISINIEPNLLKYVKEFCENKRYSLSFIVEEALSYFLDKVDRGVLWKKEKVNM